MEHYQSILPNFDVFQAGPPVRHPPPGGQMLGTPRRAARAARFVASPAAAILSGFGQEAPSVPTPSIPPAEDKPSIALAIVGLGVVGYLCYEIGAAMTPSGGDRKNWGLLGIPVGVIAGPFGLGVMAIVSNHVKR